MNDRELLEAAAKAAGIELLWPSFSNIPSLWEGLGSDTVWNPLTDDDDALRLAVKLKMTVDVTDEASGAGAIGLKWCSEPHKDDPYAATRRAIVRAAAQIGIGGEDATVAPPAVQTDAQDGRVAQPGVQLTGDAQWLKR